MKKDRIPGWLAKLPVNAMYVPPKFSMREAEEVQVIAANPHGQATIKFITGSRKNRTEGVVFSELRQLPAHPG